MPSTYSYGDFNALPLSDADREMLGTAFQAVSSVTGGWDFLRTYDPGHGGFMFSTPPPKMEEIQNAVLAVYGGHSGASYGMTMRNIEFIAKQGWDTYVQRVLHRRRDPGVGAGVEVVGTSSSAPSLPAATAPAAASFPSTCPCYRAQGRVGWCGVAGGGVPACEH